MIKKNRGITMVALVIIIIVLTIIAGVTIGVSINTGLIGFAGESKKEYNSAAIKQILDSILLSENNKYNSGLITEKQMWKNIKSQINLKSELSANIISESESGLIIKVNQTEYSINKEESSEIQNVGIGQYTGDSTKKYTDGEENTAYIPAGFTVSNIRTQDTDETTISKGLVIYSGNVTNWEADEDSDGILDVQENYNQYVWIPVENPSDMYGVVTEADTQLNKNKDLVVGEKYGKLYFKTVTDQDSHLNWPSETGYSTTSNQELVYLDDKTYSDDSSYNLDENGKKIITKEGIKEEFNNTIASIEKYKGFYIGRYELTGNVSNPSVVKGEDPLNASNKDNKNNKLRWYGLYTLCSKLENNNKVHTSMIWGCQWDQSVKVCVNYDSNFLTVKSPWKGVSGSEEATYNIYDMNGNLWDWTLEGKKTNVRIARGGNFYDTSNRASIRGNIMTHSDSNTMGCRAQLYIK